MEGWPLWQLHHQAPSLTLIGPPSRHWLVYKRLSLDLFFFLNNIQLKTTRIKKFLRLDIDRLSCNKSRLNQLFISFSGCWSPTQLPDTSFYISNLSLHQPDCNQTELKDRQRNKKLDFYIYIVPLQELETWSITYRHTAEHKAVSWLETTEYFFFSVDYDRNSQCPEYRKKTTDNQKRIDWKSWIRKGACDRNRLWWRALVGFQHLIGRDWLIFFRYILVCFLDVGFKSI